MSTTRRFLLALAALTFLALGAASCGVKSNDDTASTTDASTTTDKSPRTTEDSSSSDDDSRDEPTTTDGSSSDDDSSSETTIPDLSIPDMSIPDMSMPDFSDPDAVKDQVVDLYMQMGMSEDQANCLVDAIMELGTDGSQVDPSDLSAMFDLFDQCDISLEDLSGMGSGLGGN